MLGVEEGGLQSAEALMLARYFMYSQVYLHHVRRIYDKHLIDFLKAWVGVFPTDIEEHLAITDNEVTSALLRAAFDEASPGHIHARRIVKREHFKRIYERNPSHVAVNPEAGTAVFDALCEKFDAEFFRHDRYQQKSGPPDFPVRMNNGDIESSLTVSETLNNLPVVSIDSVFADRSKQNDAAKWLSENRAELIKPKEEDSDDG